MNPTLVFAAALILAAPAARASSAVGDWTTAKGDAKVRIAPCGVRLCGTLVWLKESTDPATGRLLTDDNNPNPALRGRSLLGLTFLWGFKSAGPDRWTGGRLYSPDSGRTYESKLLLKPDGRLKVEGCLTIFCGGQNWTRAQ